MIFHADWLFPGDAPPIRDGWLQVEGGRIHATGSQGGGPAGAEVTRHDGCVIFPGLVNAHCHLELTTLHDRLDSGKPFPVWVEQLRGYTAGLDDSN
jgi:cytosine/adenosine deaminase-related metal-dependent hydrolase